MNYIMKDYRCQVFFRSEEPFFLAFFLAGFLFALKLGEHSADMFKEDE